MGGGGKLRLGRINRHAIFFDIHNSGLVGGGDIHIPRLAGDQNRARHHQFAIALHRDVLCRHDVIEPSDKSDVVRFGAVVEFRHANRRDPAYARRKPSIGGRGGV